MYINYLFFIKKKYLADEDKKWKETPPNGHSEKTSSKANATANKESSETALHIFTQQSYAAKLLGYL